MIRFTAIVIAIFMLLCTFASCGNENFEDTKKETEKITEQQIEKSTEDSYDNLFINNSNKSQENETLEDVKNNVPTVSTVHTHSYVNGMCTICKLSRSGKSITFGSYPQSRVDDSTLKNTLNSKAGTLPTSQNSQAWTSYGYYINGAQSNFMWYIDITIDSDKYRGVYFTSYRPYYTTDPSSADDSAQDENGYYTNQVYWFKYEPILWTVLSENSNNKVAFVLCDMLIDSQEFYITDVGTRDIDGEKIYPSNYEYSTIRKWLNETFYNTAFTDFQKEMILVTTVDNSESTTNEYGKRYVCKDTYDSVFLLSCADFMNEDYALCETSASVRKPTDYAKSQGAYVSDFSDYIGQAGWLLRSPHNDKNMSCVGYTGYGGYGEIDYTIFGVLPAIQIKL